MWRSIAAVRSLLAVPVLLLDCVNDSPASMFNAGRPGEELTPR